MDITKAKNKNFKIILIDEETGKEVINHVLKDVRIHTSSDSVDVNSSNSLFTIPVSKGTHISISGYTPNHNFSKDMEDALNDLKRSSK